MAKTKSKFYGRKNPNKLDWLLALTFGVIALAALLLMAGILIKDAALYGVVALEDVLSSLIFKFDPSYLGSALAIVIIGTILIYGSLILLVCGIVYLCKKEKKERMPGLFAEFFGALFLAIFLAFIFEFMGGVGKGKMPLVFPIIAIVLMVCLLCCMCLGVYGAFSNCEIECQRKETQEPYYDPIEEPIQPKVEKVEEPEEEVKEEPVVEEVKEEEPQEGDEEFDFDQLGKRRKRIPFEKKVKRSTVDTRDRYQLIVSELRKYDFNDRMSIPGETFSYKREKLVFLTFSGNTLKVHFRLDPKEFIDSPLPIKDASEVKRFEEVPAFIKIKSDLAARRAVALGERVAEENGVPKK